MKNKFLKVCSFLLAISMLVIPVHAATPAEEMPIRAVGGSVVLYEGKPGTVTVAIETTEELECFGIEGVWDQGTNGIKLTKIEANSQMVFGEYDYIEAGKVQWNYEWTEEGTDESSEDLVNCVEGTKLLIATYEVAAGTPAGDYKVSFTSNVFTGSDWTPIDEDIVFEATITVTYHECADADRNHVCDDENCGAAQGEHKDSATDKDHVCDYCGKEVENGEICTDVTTDKDHNCDVCGKENVTEHSYTGVVTKPTCEAEGYTTYTCNCGDSYTADKVPALGHKDENADHVCDNNCGITQGEHKDSATDKDHVCDYCGKEVENGEICTDVTTDKDHNCDVCGKENVTEHSYTDVVTKPTCEEKGYTTYTCNCGHSYTADEVDALEHNWQLKDYTVTDEKHTANYVCANDANHTKSDEAVEHDFTNGDCVCGAKKPTTGLKGDLDLDGDVDSTDLTLLARHVGGIESLTGQALENADVDGDGEISANDLTVHARYVGGIIKEWP